MLSLKSGVFSFSPDSGQALGLLWPVEYCQGPGLKKVATSTFCLLEYALWELWAAM